MQSRQSRRRRPRPFRLRPPGARRRYRRHLFGGIGRRSLPRHRAISPPSSRQRRCEGRLPLCRLSQPQAPCNPASTTATRRQEGGRATGGGLAATSAPLRRPMALPARGCQGARRRTATATARRGAPLQLSSVSRPGGRGLGSGTPGIVPPACLPRRPCRLGTAPDPRRPGGRQQAPSPQPVTGSVGLRTGQRPVRRRWRGAAPARALEGRQASLRAVTKTGRRLPAPPRAHRGAARSRAMPPGAMLPREGIGAQPGQAGPLMAGLRPVDPGTNGGGSAAHRRVQRARMSVCGRVRAPSRLLCSRCVPPLRRTRRRGP